MNNSITINGLDFFEIHTQLKRKTATYERIILDELELVIKDPDTFRLVKKTVLDNFNEFSRSVSRLIISDTEEV
jgi:hypothetical protein